MKTVIHDARTISEIQREFTKEFPYLKLEFFDAPHCDKRALPKSKLIDRNKKLGEVRKNHNEGVLEIKPSDTVSDLENKFWNLFGLSVQVFRKSGNLWIETSLTDSWTLERQNREGYEMSAPANKEPEPDLTDRDVWE
ncbi:MAG: hypothetical protein NZM35_07170 [Chitinophagales bacterium]|nr:hypothetical protein [Chitinophagales bacterium]MDW8419005.1 hypothetical protein [Chitinophagales bacterium]